MKQIKFLGILAIALSLGLAACNNAGDGQGSEQQAGEQSQQAGDVSQCERHQWDTKVTIKEPTCTEPGQSQRTCKVCGAKEDPKEIKALGHDYSIRSNETPATCTTAGSVDLECSRCHDKKPGETIPATGHDFTGQIVPDTPAQIGVPGEGHYVCKNANCPGDGEHTPAWKTEAIPALVPSVSVTKAALVKDATTGVVTLKLEGTEEYYDQVPAQFKWAFGLLENSAPTNQWGQQQGQARYVTGKAKDSLVEADYNVLGTINSENKSFSVSFDLTNLVPNTGVPYKGLFRVYAGPYLADNSNYTTLSVSVDAAEGTNTSDKNYYNFYWRNDQETGSVLTLGVMPATAPFKWERAAATYVEAAGENPAHTYVEIGGEYNGSETTVEAAQAALDAIYKVEEKDGTAPVEGVKWTQAEIDAAQEGDPAYGKTIDDWKTEPVAGVDPVVRPVFIQFQSESGSSYYGPANHSGRSARDDDTYPITYELIAKQVGDKIHAYVKIDVSFMGSLDNQVLNTHINLLDKSQENCVMGDFQLDPVALPGGNKELVIFSHPNGANAASNAYGNLAFKIQDKTAA